MNDFTYDFSNYMKEQPIWYGESSLDIIVRYYIYIHQFCEYIPFETKYIPLLFNDFLEANEEIYINEHKNKILFKIKNPKDKELQKTITEILKLISISVEDINDENYLELTYRHYDNTDYRGITETIYRIDN